MRKKYWLTPALLAAGGFVAIALAAGGFGRAQPANATGSERHSGPRPIYVGVSACAQCHNLAKPLEDKSFPPVCRCTECAVWQNEDKHRLAYAVLDRERGKQMAKILGTDATKEAACLACHSVNPRRDAELDPSFHASEGVSCVLCHGAYEDWIDDHGSAIYRKRERWRQYSRERKQNEFGMTDLWDAATRTRTCTSCHVGNTAEGKVVTHEMYAAGHPPLPGFEVGNFCLAMPPHWEPLKAKSPAVRKILGCNDPAELEQTKAVIIGGMTAFVEALRLLETQARECLAGAPHKTLDLAQFDCYACHHDLKAPSWRQERGFSGTPGRPVLRRWPEALVVLAIRHAADSDADKQARTAEYHKRLDALRRTFDQKPFGDPAAVADAARQLVEWSKPTLDSLNNRRYERADAERFLHELCTLWQNQLPDYDTAREIAWAFRAIYAELDPKPPGDARVQEILTALDQELNLKLPSGQKTSVVDGLGAALQKVNDYQPDRKAAAKNGPGFRQLLEELTRALALEQPHAGR